MKGLAAALVWIIWPTAVLAAPLDLSASARLLSERPSALDSYQLPTGPFADGRVPSQRHEGRVERWTWQLTGSAVTTLQILSPLVAQLEAQGFEVVFRCKDKACGGFDFRFDIEVIPAPDMHVDIRNFRFLSAIHPDGDVLTLLVSRSRDAAYVQQIQVSPVGSKDVPVQGLAPVVPEGFAGALLADGHVALSDLDFASGAMQLTNGPYPSLQALAAFLSDREDLMLVIVGHTDSVGALDQNIELSRRRAGVVRTRLIDVHGVDPSRLRAEGMGYLSPVASNLTAQGREANRRVEAIVLPMP